MFSLSNVRLASAKLARKIAKAKARKPRTASPYAAFLIGTKRNKELLATTSALQRLKLAAKMWRNLSSAEKAAYAKKAKTIKLKPRIPKARKPSKYALFVKANYSKVKSMPAQKRLAALGKLWKQTQKK